MKMQDVIDSLAALRRGDTDFARLLFLAQAFVQATQKYREIAYMNTVPLRIFIAADGRSTETTYAPEITVALEACDEVYTLWIAALQDVARFDNLVAAVRLDAICTRMMSLRLPQ